MVIIVIVVIVVVVVVVVVVFIHFCSLNFVLLAIFLKNRCRFGREAWAPDAGGPCFIEPQNLATERPSAD